MVDGVAVIDLPRCEREEPTTPHRSPSAFVAGPENELAMAALQRVLRADAPLEDAAGLNPLYLTGPSGVGKSHLARGIARYWSQLVGAEAVGYFTAIDFARQVQAARSDRQIEFFRALMASLRLLVVEDLQHLPRRLFIERELRDTIDSLVESGGLVVVTARDDVPMEAGLRDRLLAGLSVRLCPPGLAAREELLRQAATLRGLALSDEQVRHLAAQLNQSAAQLMGALAELELGAAVQRQEPLGLRPAPTLKEISTVVARYYSLTQAALMSPARRKSLVHGRAMIVYLARQLTKLSFAQIGAGLGRRDHSTIMHAHQTLERLAATDPTTQRDLDQIRRILTAA